MNGFESVNMPPYRLHNYDNMALDIDRASTAGVISID